MDFSGRDCVCERSDFGQVCDSLAQNEAPDAHCGCPVGHWPTAAPTPPFDLAQRPTHAGEGRQTAEGRPPTPPKNFALRAAPRSVLVLVLCCGVCALGRPSRVCVPFSPASNTFPCGRLRTCRRGRSLPAARWKLGRAPSLVALCGECLARGLGRWSRGVEHVTQVLDM